MDGIITGVSVGVAMLIINAVLTAFRDKKKLEKKSLQQPRRIKKRIDALEKGQQCCQLEVLPMLVRANFVQVEKLHTGKTNGELEKVYNELRGYVLGEKADKRK